MGSVRLRMTVAYDGTGFHGFAPNDGVRTVAGELTGALSAVVGTPVTLACAGRTDKGVHARGQVVSFDVPAGTDPAQVARAVTAMLGPEVVVRDVQRAPDAFDARHSALWRAYRYTIVHGPVPDPFLARTAWHVPDDLEVRAMVQACAPLIGQHDFSSFCRRARVPAGVEGPTLVRRVLEARWEVPESGRLVFGVRATSFCHQMVRSIVGTLVDVGRGRLRAGDLLGVLAARDRQAAAPMAPAHGLCLWEVGY